MLQPSNLASVEMDKYNQLVYINLEPRNTSPSLVALQALRDRLSQKQPTPEELQKKMQRQRNNINGSRILYEIDDTKVINLFHAWLSTTLDAFPLFAGINIVNWEKYTWRCHSNWFDKINGSDDIIVVNAFAHY